MTDQPLDYEELLERGRELCAIIQDEVWQMLRMGTSPPTRNIELLMFLALLDRHLAQRVRELADEAPLQMPGPHKTYTMALRFRHCGRGEPRFNFETEEDSRDDG